MNRRRAVLALLLVLMVSAALPQTGEQARRGKIVVRVTGFAGDAGHARIGLFNQADSFPLDSAKALTGARVPVQNHEATAVFEDLPYGTYAVIAHHDANDNFRLDVNWLGRPREAYGASNNPRARLGPPRWKDAHFELQSDSTIIEIKLHT
ncbi:MAG TPA: DUF2141 domain-containing protein [bacterium]|jgi:uncharacterized protein (DUF2141 family)